MQSFTQPLVWLTVSSSLIAVINTSSTSPQQGASFDTDSPHTMETAVGHIATTSSNSMTDLGYTALANSSVSNNSVTDSRYTALANTIVSSDSVVDPNMNEGEGNQSVQHTIVSGDSVTADPNMNEGEGNQSVQGVPPPTPFTYVVAVALWKYCPLVLLPMGTVGNIMILWVLGSNTMAGGSTVSIYLRALAVSDLSLLYSGLLDKWLYYFYGIRIRNLHNATCRLHIWVTNFSGMASAWLLVAMTSQRSLSVVWPTRTRALLTERTTYITISAILVCLALCNAHLLYGSEIEVYNAAAGITFCGYLTRDYEAFSRTVWPWLDMAVSSLLPFALLIASNSALMWTVASSVGHVRAMTTTTTTTTSSSSGSGSGSGAESDKEAEAVIQRRKMSNAINRTLISLSAMFLLLTSPVCAYLIAEFYYQDEYEASRELRSTFSLFWAVVSLLWYANSVFNFYLYCVSGSDFRRKLMNSLPGRLGFLRGRGATSSGRSASGTVSETVHSTRR